MNTADEILNSELRAQGLAKAERITSRQLVYLAQECWWKSLEYLTDFTEEGLDELESSTVEAYRQRMSPSGPALALYRWAISTLKSREILLKSKGMPGGRYVETERRGSGGCASRGTSSLPLWPEDFGAG